MVHFANNAWQKFVQETPLFLNHGRHPKAVLSLGLPCKGNSQGQPTRNPASSEFLQKMQDITAQGKQSMTAAQQRQKRRFDLNHKCQEYGIGQQVLLSSKICSWKQQARLSSGLGGQVHPLWQTVLVRPTRMSETHPVFHCCKNTWTMLQYHHLHYPSLSPTSLSNCRGSSVSQVGQERQVAKI